MTPILSVRALAKSYGPRLGCRGVSFDLWPGEVMGIVGESGSGKSTLLGCLAGHLAADEGQVIFHTRDLGPRDVLAMAEPERRALSRSDWAFVHQHARDGLRMGVSAGGNVGERLMPRVPRRERRRAAARQAGACDVLRPGGGCRNLHDASGASFRSETAGLPSDASRHCDRRTAGRDKSRAGRPPGGPGRSARIFPLEGGASWVLPELCCPFAC